MKSYLAKYGIVLLVAIMMWCMIPESAQAEENKSHCYPTEEEIQMYKADGTWEQRQEYVKKLNYAAPSQELLYRAVQREYGFVRYAAGDDIPDEWKGMQVTGDAKMLLVRVEFDDVKFADSKIYSEEELYNMVMGDNTTGTFPYESLNAYYKRSSYNKLNIISDQVYSCTLSKSRDAYTGGDFGEQDLIKEVLEMLDPAVDFADYDANHDGKLDSICINFAGSNSGWGSTWWSHKYDFQNSNITFDGVTPAGYIFLETYTYDDSYGTQTLIHETGHLLGLPDYYSQTSDGIGTTDMMNNNSGDHNGFSKWLLGWIEEKNILRINRDSGETEAVLSPLSSEAPGDDKLIAVIAPEDTSIYSEYFVVQYDEYMGNQSVFELENPAYRIFHVDAQLNYDGTNFKNDNVYAYGDLLIKAVSIIEGEYGAQRYYYAEGDALTPDTNESSSFYGGNILGFTGIELTDFKTGAAPSFNIAFREKELVDGNLEFEVLGEPTLNMAKLILLSNKPLIDAKTYQEAYLEDSAGNKYPVWVSFEDGSSQIEVSYLAIANSLKAETEYTLVFPEGLFQIDKEVYSEECRITVKTGVFPEIVADNTYGPNRLSNIFALDETKAAFIQMTSRTEEEWFAKLHVFEGTEEVKEIDLCIPIPEIYTEVMDLYAIPCYDGTIAVQISAGDPSDYSRTITSYYKMDQNGTVLAGPFMLNEKLDIFPSGNGIKGTVQNSGALGAPGLADELKLEIYTIDFENEPFSRTIDMNRFMSQAYALDEKTYLVIQDLEGYQAGIYNQKDELIKSMDFSAHIDGRICTAVKVGDNLAVIHSTYSESDECVVSVSKFDMDGTYLGTSEITRFSDWKSMDGWSIEKTSWGYSLSNKTSKQPYIICFLNEDFELISSIQVPDNICSGTHMGNRCVVQWYDITVPGYRVGITEPIVDESAEVTPEPDQPSDEDDTIIPEPDKPSDGDDTVIPKPDKPSQGDSSETSPIPNTGDGSVLGLLLFVIIISGGTLFCMADRRRVQTERK